eukprot:TRINITY_DN32169_c0_g1_i1.p1 TRINITY_DN32169_c0_g1~~TRINITY_DN32169_c0_g1_i1.p1  ORF type:complete len:1145 (+),score=216.20 TRINITY_DN32169_c0_g1_i1:49-3483(+)
MSPRISDVQVRCEGCAGRAVLSIAPGGAAAGELCWMVVPDGVEWTGDGIALRDAVLGRRPDLALKYKRVTACAGAEAARSGDDAYVALTNLEGRMCYLLLAAFVPASSAEDTAVLRHTFHTPPAVLRLVTLGYVGRIADGSEAVFAMRVAGRGAVRCVVSPGDVRGRGHVLDSPACGQIRLVEGTEHAALQSGCRDEGERCGEADEAMLRHGLPSPWAPGVLPDGPAGDVGARLGSKAAPPVAVAAGVVDLPCDGLHYIAVHTGTFDADLKGDAPFACVLTLAASPVADATDGPQAPQPPTTCLFDITTAPSLHNVVCTVAAADSSDQCTLRIRADASGPGVVWCALLRAASPLAWCVAHRQLVALVGRVGGADAPLLQPEGGAPLVLPQIPGGGDVVAAAAVAPSGGVFNVTYDGLRTGSSWALLLLPTTLSGGSGLRGLHPQQLSPRPPPVHRRLLLLPDIPDSVPQPCRAAAPVTLAGISPSFVAPGRLHVAATMKCGPAHETPLALYMCIVPVNSFGFPAELTLDHLARAEHLFPGGQSQVLVVQGSGPHRVEFATIPGIHYKLLAAWEVEGFDAFHGAHVVSPEGGAQCHTALVRAPSGSPPRRRPGSAAAGRPRKGRNSGFVDSWLEGRPRPKSAASGRGDGHVQRKTKQSPAAKMLVCAREQVAGPAVPFSPFVEWSAPRTGSGGAKAAAVPQLPCTLPLPAAAPKVHETSLDDALFWAPHNVSHGMRGGGLQALPARTAAAAHRVPSADAMLEVRRLFAAASRDRVDNAEWIDVGGGDAARSTVDTRGGACAGCHTRVTKAIRVPRTAGGLARLGDLYRTALRCVNDGLTKVQLPLRAATPQALLPHWLDLLGAAESNLETEPWQLPWTVFLMLVLFQEDDRPLLLRMRRAYDAAREAALEASDEQATLRVLLQVVADDLLVAEEEATQGARAAGRSHGGRSLIRRRVHETAMLYSTLPMAKGCGRYSLSAAMGAGSDAQGFASAFAECTFANVAAGLLLSRPDLVKLTRARAVGNGPTRTPIADEDVRSEDGAFDHMAIQCVPGAEAQVSPTSKQGVMKYLYDREAAAHANKDGAAAGVSPRRQEPSVLHIYQGRLPRGCESGPGRFNKANLNRGPKSVFRALAGRQHCVSAPRQ